MKRSFSREYWFLLSSWVVFTLLGMLFGLLSDWVWKGEPEFLNRFTSPSDAASIIGSLFLELSRAFPVLAGAVLGIVVIRYWVLPCGVLFFLQWLRIFCFSLSSTVNSGLLKVVWTALTPALSLVLLFWAAKGLYLLYRGREWAVALTFVLLNFLIGLIGLLLTLGVGGEQLVLERASAGTGGECVAFRRRLRSIILLPAQPLVSKISSGAGDGAG